MSSKLTWIRFSLPQPIHIQSLICCQKYKHGSHMWVYWCNQHGLWGGTRSVTENWRLKTRLRPVLHGKQIQVHIRKLVWKSFTLTEPNSHQLSPSDNQINRQMKPYKYKYDRSDPPIYNTSAKKCQHQNITLRALYKFPTTRIKEHHSAYTTHGQSPQPTSSQIQHTKSFRPPWKAQKPDERILRSLNNTATRQSVHWRWSFQRSRSFFRG